MKISQVRTDIKTELIPIISEQGFTEIGEFGEFYKVCDNQNKHAVRIDCVKDSNAFSIQLHILIHFHEIESIFDKLATEYTLNHYLDAETISFNSYSKEKLKLVLIELISIKADKFFTEFGKDEDIISNLNSTDYKKWISGDRVTLFKVRLASAVLSKDRAYLSAIKNDAEKYCSKPWSEHNRDRVKKLCISV